MIRSRFLGVALLGLVGAVVQVTACGDDDPATPAPEDAGADVDAQVADDAPAGDAGDGGVDLVARGKYLVYHVFQCQGCHTKDIQNDAGRWVGKDLTQEFAGFECMADTDLNDPDAGCINSANLTNDPTGIKNISDADLKKMITTGVRPDGKQLFHVMPYFKFSLAKDEDLDAIIAFLRSTKPISKLIPNHQPPWDNYRPVMPLITQDQVPEPMAAYPDQASAKRGRYLATFACMSCHTPDSTAIPAYPDMSLAFTGIEWTADILLYPSPPYPPKIYSCNLTSDKETGIGSWTDDQLHNVLTKGIDRDGGAICGPMPVSPTLPGFDALFGLNEPDRQDIIHYLRSLPPVVKARGNDCVEPPL